MMPATPVKAVFCDIGGPIYDDANYLAAVGLAVDVIRLERGQSAADRDHLRQVYDAVRNAQGGSLRRAIAAEFLGGAEAAEVLHNATRYYWSHPVGSMYPDVIPFFAALAGHVKIAVLANQEVTVVQELERDGLAPYIDVWGVSALVGYEKPSPELFRLCLRETGVAPAQAAHIGNRLDTDVRPAAALGLRTVWVLRGEAPDHPTDAQRSEADIVVRSLDGLADRILSLGR
jgi:putative hydrolase of the HAD superfamily